MNPKTQSWQTYGICVLLVFAVLAVFAQTAHFGFIGYDDDANVYLNPAIQRGLSANAFAWAFTHSQTGNWVPLTTLSHMLDCQVFGLRAGGHHVVNVLWHAANTVLLFLVLRQMTGSIWRSAFVAAVFAVHPLRAESVAWVSERKDVMSGFFFILAVGVYVRQVRKPNIAAQIALVLLFALGLLAKSMVATLPFVLLLLDYWPLGRMHSLADFLRLVKEKTSLFVIGIAACVAAALVPGLVITDSRRLSLAECIGNAAVSYVIYFRQMIFPAGLATPYPIGSSGPPLWEVCLAIVLLVAISAGVVMSRKKHPSLLMGWLWYLGMLFPVIGIIQISGDAAHADRYTYLPEIGLAFAATWALADWTARWEAQRAILASLSVASIGALVVCGYNQTACWRNNKSLWTHALACTSNNSLAHNNLGSALASEGKSAEAIEQYQEALAINPHYVAALINLGNALAQNGKKDEAIAQFRKALDISPTSKSAHYNLGVALLSKGQIAEAIVNFRQALEEDPDYAAARLNLGVALYKSGHIDGAIAQYEKALEINPADLAVRANLASAFFAKGEIAKAIAQLQRAVKINPDYSTGYSTLGLMFFEKGDYKSAIDSWQRALRIKPDLASVQNNLAWLLATAPDDSLRNGAKAVALAQQANQLNHGTNAAVLHTLAAAFAETGSFTQAISMARHALELATVEKNDDLTARLPKEIKLFESNIPTRDVPQ